MVCAGACGQSVSQKVTDRSSFLVKSENVVIFAKRVAEECSCCNVPAVI